MSILVIRLGAMGDILHTLPAAASLKLSFPDQKLHWLVAQKWMPLLEGNPYIDEVIPFDRRSVTALGNCWRRLRELRPRFAVDFQGLLQSAVAGRVSRPDVFFGFDRSVAREPLASSLYTRHIAVMGPHRVERNLQIAAATGAHMQTQEAWVPAGRQEGELPTKPFVLTSPFAGWASKQWPIDCYDALAEVLSKEGLELVVNIPGQQAAHVPPMSRLRIHTSGLSGLIDATRRATAVVGVDSGPLHLAAALGKPGVALFGPTDPAQTGPYKSNMVVLRARGVSTTYKRHDRIHTSMAEITANQVKHALLQSLARPVPSVQSL